VVERALLDKMSAVFPMVLRPMPVQVGRRTSGSTVSWLPSLGAWRRPCWFCSAYCSVYAMYKHRVNNAMAMAVVNKS
jgi:hypothetical protein